MTIKRRFRVTAINGRIMDGVATKDGLFSDNAVDRTDECIRAVITLMDTVCTNGQLTLVMKDVGALTFIQFPKLSEDGAGVNE